MEAPKAKWLPGNEPAYPCKQGMTEKTGLSKREYFALEIFKSMVASGKALHANADEVSIQMAEHLILSLNPEKVSAPIGMVNPAQERNGCNHDEIFMERGVFVCFKCKQKVDKEVVLARVK
jgi:hypothetical protein